MDLKNIHIRNDSWWDLLFQAFPLVQTFYVVALAGLETPLIPLPLPSSTPQNAILSPYILQGPSMGHCTLSHTLSIPQIDALTGLKQQTIEQLLASYQCTGHVIE